MPTGQDDHSIDVERPWKLLIDGEWVEPAGGTYPVVDPNDGTVVGHAPEADAAQAADAARAARSALPAWRALSPQERGSRLARLADAIERMAPSWLSLVQAETGSVTKIAQSLQVGPPMIERFRYYSEPINLDEDVAPMPAAKGALGPAGLIAATVKRHPVGVVACVTPYNMPLVNVAGKVAPALAAGNTVVIKPAPQDPLGVLLLGEAVAEAGLGDGVVNIVTGSGPEAPAALVASPDVNMVSFTGSTEVGARIYADGAATMKRVLMELGGKGALVMTDDADVNAACMGIATTWGLHSGQICTAPTRVICHRSIYEQTVDTLKAFAGFMKVGDARAEDTVVGPVITAAHRDRVESFIAGGIASGATAVCGGQRPDLPGYFVAPTLLVDVSSDMDVVRDEAFRAGGGGAAPRRRRRGRGTRQRLGVRAVLVRVRRRRQTGLRDRLSARVRQRGPQHGAAAHVRTLRRVQDVGHRPRPGQVGHRRLHRDPGRQLARLGGVAGAKVGV